MPKNPVRAARQAGRQAVRAAKNTRRETIGAAKTASKVAKIESKTASKVGKISGTATAKPVAKAAPAAYKPVKLPVTPVKLNTAGMRSTLPDVDADNAREAKATAERKKAIAAKKGPSESEKNIVKMWRDKGYEYGKDGKVRDKNGKTPEENESQRVKDMFLQPGETPRNTSPFASKEVAAKRALKDALAKVPFGKKKAGGSVKKYQAGGMTTGMKPPRSIRGPKQSASDMRQPYGPSMKPVGPGNTARPPKYVRKAGPSTPASMMKSMKKGGTNKRK